MISECQFLHLHPRCDENLVLREERRAAFHDEDHQLEAQCQTDHDYLGYAGRIVMARVHVQQPCDGQTRSQHEGCELISHMQQLSWLPRLYRREV